MCVSIELRSIVAYILKKNRLLLTAGKFSTQLGSQIFASVELSVEIRQTEAFGDSGGLSQEGGVWRK